MLSTYNTHTSHIETIFLNYQMELNKYSRTVTQDPTLPAAQAMLYGIGLTEEDLKKAQVGVVSTGYDGNTCNMHLNDLAKEVKTAVWPRPARFAC